MSKIGQNGRETDSSQGRMASYETQCAYACVSNLHGLFQGSRNICHLLALIFYFFQYVLSAGSNLCKTSFHVQDIRRARSSFSSDKLDEKSLVRS